MGIIKGCLGAGDRAGSTKGQRREVIRPRRFGGKARAGEPTMGGRSLRTMAAPFHYLTDFRGVRILKLPFGEGKSCRCTVEGIIFLSLSFVVFWFRLKKQKNG